MASTMNSLGQEDAAMKAPPPIESYLPVGCLVPDNPSVSPNAFGCESAFCPGWIEIEWSSPEFQTCQLGLRHEMPVRRLLRASWLRLLAKETTATDAIYRVYWLPNDVARISVLRDSKSLQADAELVLSDLLVSPELWTGRGLGSSSPQAFDCFARKEEGSLFYIFNTLPSPNPQPQRIRERFSKAAAEDILNHATSLPCLKTLLYPYQARSAATMIQLESSTELYDDARFEPRIAPDGSSYFFVPRQSRFYKYPQHYASNRGGILAETMGLGKTLICLAVILATKHHLPKPPPQHVKPSCNRGSVPSLLDLAVASAGRHFIPVQSYLSRVKRETGVEFTTCMKKFNDYVHDYYLPVPEPRSLRRRRDCPPRRVLVSSGTLVVVPRNLVQQWRSEIRKHVVEGSEGLKVLVMDNASMPLPDLEDLIQYDVVLFSKPRFEKEASDGVEVVIGQTPRTIHDDSYVKNIYRSPLRDIHWLRIIIDEGHEFSSASSNAVQVSEKLVTAERRWVVSGTPARDRLYGVEVDLASTVEDASDLDERIYDSPGRLSRSNGASPSPLSRIAQTPDRRKKFETGVDTGASSAAKSIGLLVQHFLRTRPWAQDDSTDARSPQWEDYIYRHEHFRSRTFAAFSSCLRKTLENLVVKTQPDDVEKDIILPPLVHKVVRLEPSFYDTLTYNLFILVLTGNAVTSERSDADYLFNGSARSAKARYQLVANLRQSNFFWTGFSVADVQSAMGHATEYLKKDETQVNCSEDDRQQLSSCVDFAEKLLASESWTALSKYHELGLFVRDWPDEAGHYWALNQSSVDPMLIGVSQLSSAQSRVNERLHMDDALQGLKEAGALVMLQLHNNYLETLKAESATSSRMGVPNSGIQAERSPSKRPVVAKSGARKSKSSDVRNGHEPEETPAKKRKSNMKSPIAVKETDAEPPRTNGHKDDEIPLDSPLRKTCVIGTVSAKMSYLLDKISQLYVDEKIIVFYDGNNAAWYLSQCLDLLHIKHLIYAKTLNNFLRSKYIVAFDTDDSIRVLLMDIKCGAYGLNVNKASRVFFINPVCRPSTEAQAIKRAHRIGQTKPVYVETLVLNDTIEARIFERSNQMTQTEHIQAAQLSDDNVVAQIIQDARLIPIDMENGTGHSQMAALGKPMQVFGRPGWKDTKIRGIDHDLFNDGTDANGQKPSAKKRAVKNGVSSSVDSTSHLSSTPSVSGPQLMYTPKWDLFASQPQDSVGTASDSINIDAIPSSVFGGNQRQPLSSHAEKATPDNKQNANSKPDNEEPSVLSQVDIPDQSPTHVMKSLALQQAGKSNPWVTQSPSLVLLNGNHSDDNFENWSVEDRPEEEPRMVWSHQSEDSTKDGHRSLFGWGSHICKY